MKIDLSVIIPARNEEFLQRTIDDVLSKTKANTEVIAILDGYWPDKGIPQHPMLKIIHHEESIGQRAATNEGAKISTAKYIMKLDAHCMVDEGFDVKLMETCAFDWVVIPRMYVLDAFHWVCSCCKKEFPQGPLKTNCDSCGSPDIRREVIWDIKKRKKTDYMWFDKDLRIKYFDRPSLSAYGDVGDLKKRCSHKKREWAKGDITDVMVGIGACWFLHREYYWKLGGMDEGHGSWGQMAVELACKTWLSGGRQVVNKNTWFAHLPRTQKGFSWPYDNPVKDQVKARKYSKDMWLSNKWEGRKYDLDWLINKFGPLPSWEEKELINTPEKKELTKGLVYYTDFNCDENILKTVKRHISNICNGYKLVSVTLDREIDFGDNIVVYQMSRSPLAMFLQILRGLKKIDTDIVFLIEHDVLYHPSHFDFIPPKKDVFYYNTNVWKLRLSDGHAVKVDDCKQVGGLCAYRELLVEHYEKRVDKVLKNGFSRKMGFEPGTHNRSERVDDYKAESWQSKFANIDIRHDKNLTANRWKKEKFRNKKYTKGWTEVDDAIAGWGWNKELIEKIKKGDLKCLELEK